MHNQAALNFYHDLYLLTRLVENTIAYVYFFAMQVQVNPAIAPIVHDFKSALKKLYGERLQDVVLYGSYVRGDYDDESYINLLVVLNDREVNTIYSARSYATGYSSAR